MNVRTAVIPVAGFGTRFLPVTRSVPKALVPVIDTPPVQYAVAEAADAGIDRVVLVVSPGQESVARYFETDPELVGVLERRGDERALERMRRISEMANVEHVYQERPLGLGHAVLTARDAVGDEPFAVLLPDDIIWSDAPTIGAMVDIFSEREGAVVAVREVPDEAVAGLGIVDPVRLDERVCEVAGMVEKPALVNAPSNLAIIGRYVLPPDVFEAIARTRPGALGEIQLTDAISTLLGTPGVFAYEFPGVHFDVGAPLGLLRASVYSALNRGEAPAGFRDWLSELLSTNT